MTELLTPESEEDFGGKPSPGTPADKRKRVNKPGAAKKAAADDTEMDAPPVMTEAPMWRGPLVVEGTPTGDGREFALDSLSWADPPLPLRWQYEDSHGGVPQNKTVNVGTIQRVYREPGPDGTNQIMAEGIFDLGGSDDDLSHEAYRRNQAGALTGISIDADDITDADVEYVWADPEEGEEDDEDSLFKMLFAAPDKIIFHSARVRAATLCDIPAFVEAKIMPIPEDERSAMALEAAKSNVHETATSDGTWDSAVHASRVVEATVDHEVFGILHHEVGEDGVAGAANVTACAAGIGLLHGGRGGSELSESDRRLAYDHLAKHLEDAGQTPPPFETSAEVIVASSWTDQVWRPPAEWFTNPGLGQYVPIMVTDAGRVYGHAAAWAQCHLGYMDECVMPPREDLHAYFLTGEVPLDDGTTVAVGQITAGIEHAALHLSASKAKEHYENTDACVADVVVGNDKHGIWVAGAIRPWAHASRVHSLRASGQVSPDWRRIGGALRMVALLTVNTSGYQAPSSRSFVASGEIRSLVASGIVPVQRPKQAELSEEELEQIAMRAVQRKLIERVHGKREV
jgi:hypothetical protein